MKPMQAIDLHPETNQKRRVVAMARSNILINLKQSVALLAITSALALAGCGDGDGKPSIQNAPVTPLPELPAGFCDPINFEILCPPPDIINFNGGATEVVDNPDRSGINDSEVVARMQKFGDQPFGGTRLNPVETPVDFSGGEVYKIKVWSERAVPVTFKLEETTDGTLGVERVANHTGGSEWQELCFDFSGATPANTIGLTIIFDNGVLGAAIAGVFAGDWTFYYDDIEQVQSCSGAGAATGVEPDVSLYDPAGSADLVAGTDYTEITAFGSGSVIDLLFADDATFSPVLAVSSGAGYGANVAQIGFVGFDAGFLTVYDSIIFKAKGLPNSVIFVKLFDNVDSLRINLTSSGFSEALDNGWYQVTIPLSNFSGLTTATGLVFESDNTAATQFTMLLNDVGFGESSGGGGPPPPPTTPSLGVFSETNTSPTVNITDIVSAGNTVTINSTSTAVTPFDGTVSLGLTFSTGGQAFGGAIFQFDDEDVSSFDTLKFAIDTSTFANLADLTVQLEPPGGGTPGGNVFLSAYTPVSTTGNWDVYEIPLADFTAVNLTLVNRLGFFNARDGSDTLLAGTLYLDDIHFTTVSSGGGGGGSSVLVNGDFEDNGGSLDGWTVGLFDNVGGGLGSITDDSSGQGGRGGTVARLIVDASTASFNDAVISQEGLGAGTVTAGDTVTVTFDLYGTPLPPGGVVFAEVIFLNAMGQDEGGRDFLNSDPAPLNPTTTWTPVSGTVTAGTGQVAPSGGGSWDVSGGLVLSLKVSCGPVDGCAQDVSFDNVTFTIN